MKNILNILFGKEYNKVQFFQTIILISILFIGVYKFGLYLDFTKITTVFISVVVFDLLLSYVFYRSTTSWLNNSKINMAFGILFFLRTDLLLIYIFVSFITVLSKYIFLYKGKRHFFNPSNFGVSFALLLFPPYAYTNPLQWTFDVSGIIYIISFIVVCIVGLFLVEYILYRYLKINQIYLILPFIIFHLILFFSIGSHETINSALGLFSISFLIFSFFMITDPMTTPKNNINKIFFGSSVAIMYYVLSYFTNENFNLIWSLFIILLFLPVIWSFEDKYNDFKKYLGGLIIFLISLILLLSLFYLYGHLDLQFANRCISIICSN